MQKLYTDIRQLLKDIPEVLLAYLFGSQINGNIGPLSDFDFAILSDRNANEAQLRSSLGSALAQKLESNRIDLVILHNAPIELAFAIISKGRLLYERDVRTRVDYEARIMGLYFDYVPFLKTLRQDIIKGDEHAARVRRYRQALGRTQGALGSTGANQGKTTQGV